MLSKYNENRTHLDNLSLGGISAFVAGSVNVASVIVFFAFTSNVTGHYAILAEEIAKGNWYQAAVVFAWIFAFFSGNFFSNLSVIHLDNFGRYLAHSLPMLCELLILLFLGFYGVFYYSGTLVETEWMVGMLLFAMGLQNGLTASISNFGIKTTHMTGLTTDLGILFSMFTKAKFRNNVLFRRKAQLLLLIASSYMLGGILSGMLYLKFEFGVFFFSAGFVVVILAYDWIKIQVLKNSRNRRIRFIYRARKEQNSKDKEGLAVDFKRHHG